MASRGRDAGAFRRALLESGAEPVTFGEPAAPASRRARSDPTGVRLREAMMPTGGGANEIGSDASSPTMIQTLDRWHHHLTRSVLGCHPELKVTFWHDHLYAYVLWHPQGLRGPWHGEVVPALRPFGWHTTIAVADLPWDRVPETDAEPREVADIRHLAAACWQSWMEVVSRGADGYVQVQLGPTGDWGWNMGFSWAWKELLASLTTAIEGYCWGYGLWIRPRRPFHISWNVTAGPW